MSSECETSRVEQLELESTVGFNGHIPGGLHVHPDRSHIIYAIGCNIVVEEIASQKQTFLSGHTNQVSCLAVSKSGRFIASGQVTHMGFIADIIVWDYVKKEKYATFMLHKVKVEAVAFSPGDHFLVSLGGRDDNSVAIWDLSKKEAVCGSPAAMKSAGCVFAVAFANQRDDIFVTGGDKTLRIWELDVLNRKIRPTDANLGQLKRVVKCLQVNNDDEFVFCGTTSGDILQINMKTKLLSKFGPQKSKFSLGVLSLVLLKTGDMLVGTGDGIVALLKGEDFKKVRSAPKQLKGQVMSLGLRGGGHQVYIGTSVCHIYRCSFAEFAPELVHTCHFSAITDINFPKDCSELFATSSNNDLRVWDSETRKELIRIVMPNMTCNAFSIMDDGKSIMTGWNDGKIRAYTPETGKLMYTIHDAHNSGVTAIATTSDCHRIISGGGEGQVRVWDVVGNSAKMKGAMKEHRGTVSCIKVRSNDLECVSASADGTCIIWNLQRFVRNQIIFANTLFKAVCYRPDETQIITSGTDRQVGYWETFDGSAIRELEASATSSINAMDISPDGQYFVTGSEDRLIKVWQYDKGEVTHIGTGHGGSVTRLKICPNQRHIVSVSNDGAILKWKWPTTPALTPHNSPRNGAEPEQTSAQE